MKARQMLKKNSTFKSDLEIQTAIKSLKIVINDLYWINNYKRNIKKWINFIENQKFVNKKYKYK